MELRIKDAMDLHNARVKKTGKGEKMSRQTLGRVIYSNSTDSCVMVSMGNLLSGFKKKLNPSWIVVICEECGVDPNFLYREGTSKFNKEFDSYFPSK